MTNENQIKIHNFFFWRNSWIILSKNDWIYIYIFIYNLVKAGIQHATTIFTFFFTFLVGLTCIAVVQLAWMSWITWNIDILAYKWIQLNFLHFFWFLFISLTSLLPGGLEKMNPLMRPSRVKPTSPLLATIAHVTVFSMMPPVSRRFIFLLSESRFFPSFYSKRSEKNGTWQGLLLRLVNMCH